MGLGMLSKYNYFFLILTLFLASISFKEGRTVTFNKKTVITILLCILILLPHIFWLKGHDYTALWHGIKESKTGFLAEYQYMEIFSVLSSPLIGLSGFFFLFTVFFYPYFSRNNSKENPKIILFRWAVFYGLLIPLLTIVIFRPGHFSTRWLSPIYIIVPIASFSIVSLESDSIRFKKFGILCAIIAMIALCARIFFGFMPDITGKVTRIQIPFEVLSVKLNRVLQDNRFDNKKDLIITDRQYIAANLAVYMPHNKFLCLDSREKYMSVQSQLVNKEGILLLDRSKTNNIIQKKLDEAKASNRSFHLEAPYLHSKKHLPYILDGIFINELGESNTLRSLML